MSKGLILCATEFEMARFLENKVGLVKEKTLSGLTLYSGSDSGASFDCLITGPGVFNTAHALTVYLEHARPNLILDTGIAGIFDCSGSDNPAMAQGIGRIRRIGDVGIANREQYIHTGVGCNTPQASCLPFDLIENRSLTRQGIYSIDPNLFELYHGLLTREFTDPIVRGNFITVSSITASLDQAQKYYQFFSCVMEAMEGAAALHVATLYHVPIIEIRAASNFVGERDKDKWDFPLACDRVRQICDVVIANEFKTA